MAGQIVESGGQALTIGAMADGTIVVRSGTTLAGWARAYFSAYRTNTFDMPDKNTWYDYPWDVAATHKVGFTHNHASNAEQITITAAGDYRVSWRLQSTTAADHHVLTRLLVDGTEVAGSNGQFYAAADRVGEGHFKKTITVTAGQVLEVQVGTTVDGSDIVYYDSTNAPDPTTFVSAAIEIERVV